MSYTQQQAYEASLKYFKGDELAAKVFVDKYALKNGKEYYELTPDDMHLRLAHKFAEIEARYDHPMSATEIFELIRGFRYIIPQGSPMAGIGNPFVNTSISNCFVIGGHDDSYGGILRADEEQAQLMKRRGGVGQDISFLRPSGAFANGAPLGPNAGAPLYMNRFSSTTREVQQDGRRGALMLSISMIHPDAEKFIDKKMTEGEVTGANVSVKVIDDFMNCLEHNQPFYQRFPITADIWEVTEDYDRNDEDEVEFDKLYPGKVIDGVQTYFKKINAKRLWDKIVYNAWKSAEPGILFWDKILSESPASGYGEEWREVSTNPCGEIPLSPYDSCRLLSLNLYSYIYKPFTKEALLEDELLIDHVFKAMRLMDDIVDIEIERIDGILASIKKEANNKFREVEIALWKKIRHTAEQGRRTGLGVLGEADLIAALGYRYGTPEATEFSEKLHQLIATSAYQASILLAKERGAFPAYDPENESGDFLMRMFTQNELMTRGWIDEYCASGRRNIGVLTIAPTGTTSLMTQTTSGIEPVFSPYHYRMKRAEEGDHVDFVDEMGDKWVEFPVFHRPFIDWYAIQGEVDFHIAEYQLKNLSKEKVKEIFEASPYYQATAQDVDYIEKVRMQGAVQKWVDHSISVTVNMPSYVDVKMVNDVYFEAWRSGCKGITVYRDGSRAGVLSTESKKVANAESFEYINALKRPKVVECDVFFRSARKENFIIFVGIVDGKPYEIFAVPENDATHISHRIKKGQIIKRGSGEYYFEAGDGLKDSNTIKNLCSHMVETEQNETRSVSAMLRHRIDPKYIAEVISKFATISSFHKVIERVIHSYVKNEGEQRCPECGGSILMTEGCLKCKDCGYAKCG